MFGKQELISFRGRTKILRAKMPVVPVILFFTWYVMFMAKIHPSSALDKCIANSNCRNLWRKVSVSPKTHIHQLVVSEVLVLVNTSTRTVIVEEKVNVADLKNVPQLAVLNVLKILTVN